MLKQTKIAFLVSALVAGAAFSTPAAALVVNQPMAREAGETRGEGKGHPAIEAKEQLARRGADDRQADDRGGRRNSAEPVDQLARRGADDNLTDPFDDNGGNKGGSGYSTDFMKQLAAKGRGNDGNKPEDDGVDAPDGCDDNGDDNIVCAS